VVQAVEETEMYTQSVLQDRNEHVVDGIVEDQVLDEQGEDGRLGRNEECFL
jgi:hypothetical protein